MRDLCTGDAHLQRIASPLLRILGEDMVALMTSDQLPEGVRVRLDPIPGAETERDRTYQEEYDDGYSLSWAIEVGGEDGGPRHVKVAACPAFRALLSTHGVRCVEAPAGVGAGRGALSPALAEGIKASTALISVTLNFESCWNLGNAGAAARRPSPPQPGHAAPPNGKREEACTPMHHSAPLPSHRRHRRHTRRGRWRRRWRAPW